MTDREEFEKWYKSTNKGELSRFEIWQAATLDEYLRDTHVEGMPKEPYNLVAILNDPMRAYPHNFSTPAKGNALLFGLCQEAADEIERLKAETQEPMIIKQENGMVLKLGYDELPNGTAFYTTPSREWQSLSDEEIKEIHNASVGKDIGFATGLTEEKLKEKNNVT